MDMKFSLNCPWWVKNSVIAAYKSIGEDPLGIASCLRKVASLYFDYDLSQVKNKKELGHFFSEQGYSIVSGEKETIDGIEVVHPWMKILSKDENSEIEICHLNL